MAKVHTHSHRQVKHPKHTWTEKPPSIVPADVQAALKTAMTLEQVDDSEFNDLLWIMAQESEGKVDTKNPKSTARGLYQLLEAQYSLNPHGVKSFGNAVEESQGGIHYIMGRYHSASAAKAFWMKHKWY